MSPFHESVFLILASIIAGINTQNPCEIYPVEKKLYIGIYINGGTEGDKSVIKSYCSSPFTADQGPINVTFKAGAAVIEDANGYRCVNEPEGSCLYAYFLLCLSRLTDRPNFNKLLCCTVEENKFLFQCILDFGFSKGVDDCFHNRLSFVDPVNEVLENARYMKQFNIASDDVEPYILFGSKYDRCKSDLAKEKFTETICMMLDTSVAESLNCPN